MSGETRTTIVGNLGDDIELRYTTNGVPVARARVAVTPRKRDGEKWVDGEVTWWDVTMWRNLAQNAVESLRKGERVIAYGTFENQAWEGKEGDTRLTLRMEAEAFGPDVSWVTATLGDGVHDGAKTRKKRDPKPDAFEEAGAAKTAEPKTEPKTADDSRAAQAAESPASDW